MMEDNKIAVLCLVAGEEVQENIAKAQTVEKTPDGRQPNFVAEMIVKREHERNVDKPQEVHEHHDEAPVKSIKEWKRENCVAKPREVLWGQNCIKLIFSWIWPSLDSTFSHLYASFLTPVNSPWPQKPIKLKFIKHLPELAVRMNYVPVIAEHVTCNFLINSIGWLKVFLGLRMGLRHDGHEQKKRDETVSVAIYDFLSIFKWIIVHFLTSPRKKIEYSPRNTQSCSTVTSSKFNFRCRKLPPDILVLDSLNSSDILTRQRQTNETQCHGICTKKRRDYCEFIVNEN